MNSDQRTALLDKLATESALMTADIERRRAQRMLDEDYIAPQPIVTKAAESASSFDVQAGIADQLFQQQQRQRQPASTIDQDDALDFIADEIGTMTGRIERELRAEIATLREQVETLTNIVRSGNVTTMRGRDAA